jgi:hypothetical protein
MMVDIWWKIIEFKNLTPSRYGFGRERIKMYFQSNNLATKLIIGIGLQAVLQQQILQSIPLWP